jgi:hypothetical protein
MLKVIRELEAAVNAALELGNDDRGDGYYSRVTSLRRVERTLKTFRNEFIRVQRAFDARNEIETMEQSNTSSLSLDDESVGLLVDILTKLPCIYCSEPQGDGDHQPIDLNRRYDISTISGLDEMFESIEKFVSQMILDYAHMPLDLNLIDGLLDRVALLAFHGSVSCELISILNASAAASLSESAELHFSQENSSLHDRFSHEKSPLFLLGAEETLSLTQILTPISLQHLSRSFDFLVNFLNGEEKMGSREGEVGLRLLLFHIFRHLSDTLPKGSQSRIDALRICHNQWFRGQMNNNNKMEYELENEYEDYMDMLKSFLAENIEFAFDALNVSNKLIPEISEKDHMVHQIKQVTRLSSLAVGIADLFQEELDFDMSFFRSQLEKLFVTFANYVANYCHGGFIPGKKHVMLLADETLFRLYVLVSANSVEKLPKRNRIGPISSALQKYQAQTIVYLRASYLYASEFNAIDTSVVNMELDRLVGIIQNPLSNQDDTSKMDPYAAKSLLQARVLSCIVIGDNDESRLQIKNNTLLSLLLTHLAKCQDQKINDEHENASKTELSPWNYLLAQMILESTPCTDTSLYLNGSTSITPSDTILSNNSSFGSDLKGQLSSSENERNDMFNYPTNVISFAQSVHSHINTLCHD